MKIGANQAAVQQAHLRPARQAQDEEIQAFYAYADLDNKVDIGFDRESTLGLVVGVDAQGSTHQAVLFDTPSTYQMRVSVTHPDQSVKRHYSYQKFSSQARQPGQKPAVHLSDFHSVTIVTHPDGRSEGVVQTSRHPLANSPAEEGQPKQEGQGPANVVRIAIAEGEVPAAIAAFDQALTAEWMEVKGEARPSTVPHRQVLEEVAPATDATEAELDAMLDDLDLDEFLLADDHR